MFSQATMLDPSRVNLLVMPVGPSDATAHEQLVDILVEESRSVPVVRLNATKTPQSELEGRTSSARLFFEVLARDSAGREWDHFHPFKRVHVFLGVGQCKSKEDTALATQEFREKRKEVLRTAAGFPLVTLLLLWADNMAVPRNVNPDGGATKVIPLESKLDKLRVFVRGVVEDLGASVLDQFEVFLRRPAFPALLSTPLDVYDDNVGNDEKLKEAQLRRLQPGRVAKYKGDVCLLCGSPSDALRFYKQAFAATQQNNDWVWNASSIEGQTFAVVAKEVQDSSEAQRDAEFLPVVVESYFEVFHAYSRHRPYTALLAIEAVLRLLSYVSAFQMNNLAFEMIGDVAEIATDCSGREQLKVLVELAILSEALQLKRRSALLLFEAAMFYQELQQHESAKRLILESLPLFGVPLLGRPLSSSSSASSRLSGRKRTAASQQRLMQARARSEQLRAAIVNMASSSSLSQSAVTEPQPPVWLELHCEVFVSLAHSCSCSREPDPWLSAAVISTFLRLYHPWLNSARQYTLRDALHECSRSSAMPVDAKMDLIGMPDVRHLRFLRRVDDAEPVLRPNTVSPLNDEDRMRPAQHNDTKHKEDDAAWSSRENNTLHVDTTPQQLFLFAPKTSRHQRNVSLGVMSSASNANFAREIIAGKPVYAGTVLELQLSLCNPLQFDLLVEAVCVKATYSSVATGERSFTGKCVALVLPARTEETLVQLELELPAMAKPGGAINIDGVYIQTFNLRSFCPINEYGCGMRPPTLTDFSARQLYDEYKAALLMERHEADDFCLSVCSYQGEFHALPGKKKSNGGSEEQELDVMRGCDVIEALPQVVLESVKTDGELQEVTPDDIVKLMLCAGEHRTLQIGLRNKSKTVDAKEVSVTLTPMWSASMRVSDEEGAAALQRAIFGDGELLGRECRHGISAGGATTIEVPLHAHADCSGAVVVVSSSAHTGHAWRHTLRVQFQWTVQSLSLISLAHQNIVLCHEGVVTRFAEVKDPWQAYRGSELLVARVSNTHDDAFEVSCGALRVCVPPRAVVDCVFPVVQDGDVPMLDAALKWCAITAARRPVSCSWGPVPQLDRKHNPHHVQWQCYTSHQQQRHLAIGEQITLRVSASGSATNSPTTAELICIHQEDSRAFPVAFATAASNIRGRAAWHGAMIWSMEENAREEHTLKFACLVHGLFCFYVRWSNKHAQDTYISPLLLPLVCG